MARPPLSAASLEGHVLNGTTNQPISGAQVQYIQLQQGMTPVASATTDSRGLFLIEGAEAFGGSPALLQVEYQGATYSQPLMAPQSPPKGLQILVYDASRDKSLVAVVEHAIFLRPAAGELMVIEQISLENLSNPPRTYVNPEGTYVFSLPGTPRDGVQASIQGTAGMPITQVPTPLGRTNSFAITYPIRPGESQVRLQYSLDYQAPYNFTKILHQPAEQTHVVTPGEGVQVSGDNLTALGKDPTTGFAAYLVRPTAGMVKLDVTGEAPATQAESQTAESGGLIQIPDAATDRRWLILSALGLILLAGLVYLYRS
ncbi:MAG: hypothetical protein HY316_07710 [Acidobacteria bacterium]|nr:hypothetical protein [Acidobacteriota bacterium]